MVGAWQTLGRMDTQVIILFGSGTLAVALFVVMQRRLGPLKPSIIRAQLSFTEQQFRAILDKWGPTGVERFSSHFPLDYFFLLSYAVFGFTFGSWLIPSSASSPLWKLAVQWVLPVAAVCDAVENILHQWFIRAVPNSLPKASYLVSGIASTLKWVLSCIFPFLVVSVILGNVT